MFSFVGCILIVVIRGTSTKCETTLNRYCYSAIMPCTAETAVSLFMKLCTAVEGDKIWKGTLIVPKVEHMGT